jgi:RimJ/RimL family protein N-acetyltransferase
VTYPKEHVAAFVAGQLGFERGFDAYTALGFGEPLVAGVIYHNWNPEAGVIELSAASSGRDWLTRERLRQVFGYPFDQLECQMCVARISEGNARARRIWKAIGASEYIIPRLRGPREAEVIAILTVETWRAFERKTHGKITSARAA